MEVTREDVAEIVATPVVSANPIPLGLAGLALTVALFGTFSAGRLHVGTLMMSTMMLFFGGVVTLIAAILAYRNGDTLVTTVFGAFSAFWAGLGVLFYANVFGHTLTPLLTGSGFTWFWFCWAVVASYLWLASLRMNFAFSTFIGLMAAMLWCL